jgi:hypothetical protein
MNSRVYRVGHEYRDLTKRVPEDEFINWVDTDGHTIGTTGGIRPKRYIDPSMHNNLNKVPSSLFLITTRVSQQYHNPWDDIVDYSTGQILYWGDAKFDITRREKKHNEFMGNRILEGIHDLILRQNLALVPPILHFTKLNKGLIQFSGLCVLDRLETTWYEDKERPIKNFRCHLSILDTEVVDVNWLHFRASAKSIPILHSNAPEIWNDYTSGRTKKLILWRKLVRTNNDQLPLPGSDESNVLEQVCALTPLEFECFCTALFQDLAAKSGVQHDIQGTRLVRDGGFDFFGKFILPYPLHYEINFKGQAKRYMRENSVSPEDVSRLVARLQRGEYGIFITTSYYTKAAQEEVYEDNYPVRLFSGIDIVSILRLLGLIVNKTQIKNEWLERVKTNSKLNNR